jgi:large subunit ribosomal protein L1
MAKGKRYKAASTNLNRDTRYDVDSAFKLVVEGATAKFDETIDVAINLGIDPKQSDQQVRGAVSLPNGLGKAVRVVVFAKGPKEQEAKDAGADYVGADDLVEKINGGWMDFDKAIATPDMMGTVAKVAKVLGPRGLMPNPKVGTVTLEVGKAIAAEKKGKCDYRIDKAGIVHAPVGKKSMGAKALKENFETLMSAIIKAKPATSKGNFLKGITVSSTMGPGVKVDVNKVISGDNA